MFEKLKLKFFLKKLKFYLHLTIINNNKKYIKNLTENTQGRFVSLAPLQEAKGAGLTSRFFISKEE